jgi:hypothetical protein
MKKINFSKHILPHAVAVVAFLIVTVFFFSPVFFKHQKINQHDIQEWEGTSKQVRDFRDKTGEEALWTNAMFSGMPAYLINVKWSNGIVTDMKSILAVGLPHPVNNIFLAFISYYILLLAFGVRPYLAITGALAFGLSSFMIIGVSAGHNARIGAIAFMPLVMAGIHLAFSEKRILGFGITTGGLALHLRENHPQMTYYLLLIVVVYGIVQLVFFLREKKLAEFFKTVGLLLPAALIGAGTFFGQLWAITEYSNYTIRGKNELTSPTAVKDGLTKSYAFEYSNGILEPMTLLIPNFYGGSTADFLVRDQKSNVYTALVNSGDEKMANQLAGYARAYWGPQFNTSPYYAGAIIFFLFIAGIVFADRKYVVWLVPLSVLSIMLSWGSSFETFNYLMFDMLPAYNKFRSVTFTLIIILFAMPLLGLLGLEKLIANGVDKTAKKKLLIILSVTGGLCLLLLIAGGMMSFMRDEESQLPVWLTDALIKDRKSMFRGDAFRSLIFIVLAFIMIYFEAWKKITPLAFFAILAFLSTIDIAVVDKRYFNADNFQRKKERAAAVAMTEANEEILKDQSYYRVYNIQGTMSEAQTSYYHNSIGGYHGAKLRNYLDLYDSCIIPQTNRLINDLQAGKIDFSGYGAINMLNVKYFIYGPARNNIIPNDAANGAAWFVRDIVPAKNANDEFEKTCDINTKQHAVINESLFTLPAVGSDSSSTINIIEHKPNFLKYESQSTANGLAVFSEIYYPKGWIATIDGKTAAILRANYILRALSVPAGKHTIEFSFKPDAYFIGNKITLASSWIMLLVVLGCLGVAVKEKSA